MLRKDVSMAKGEAVAAHDLAYLREEALGNVLLYVGLGLYCWCAVMFPASHWFEPVWRGPALLLAGLLLAVGLRRQKPSLAAAVTILAMAIADIHTYWVTGGETTPYLLALVVGLTGLLFSLPHVVGVSIACSSAVFAIGYVRWGYLPYSSQLLAPVLVIAAVGILSALSVRNLYLALYWAWDRAMAAQRIETELRERQAELASTAKALDEACQRLEHLNYDLAQARQAAEEARLLKQQFTTAVSHELRTPLNVILAFSEMMCHWPQSYGGTPLPPEYVGDVREIHRSSQHLLHLIDDVLELSQIESHRLRLQVEPVALSDTVAEAVEIMRPLLRGKDVDMGVELPTDLPQVLADRARVRQVLLNLLNNARRFTDHGRIEVRAAVDGRHARVTVADTGIGIAPRDHERVFEEFRQLDGATTRRRDGTGLGLAISKRFVEMHGGRIWVESTGVPGEGSRFHFTLPLVGHGWAETASLQRTPVSLTRPRSRGRGLLVIDKDPDVVHLLEQELEEYRVACASNAAEVQRLADELQPQAIILNTARRNCSGWATQAYRQALNRLSLPVVTCPLVAERQLSRALGAVDYLVKPISRAALVGLLDELGPEVRQMLIVDDDPRMARVLARMIRSTGRHYEVGRAYSGSEALARMRRRRPQLVLLDLVMPEMDGHALLAAMREDEALRGIPVAVITGQDITEAEERKLGGKSFQVALGCGFSNREVLRLLRGTLKALDALTPLAAGE